MLSWNGRAAIFSPGRLACWARSGRGFLRTRAALLQGFRDRGEMLVRFAVAAEADLFTNGGSKGLSIDHERRSLFQTELTKGVHLLTEAGFVPDDRHTQPKHAGLVPFHGAADRLEGKPMSQRSGVPADASQDDFRHPRRQGIRCPIQDPGQGSRCHARGRTDQFSKFVDHMHADFAPTAFFVDFEFTLFQAFFEILDRLCDNSIANAGDGVLAEVQVDNQLTTDVFTSGDQGAPKILSGTFDGPFRLAGAAREAEQIRFDDLVSSVPNELDGRGTRHAAVASGGSFGRNPPLVAPAFHG